MVVLGTMAPIALAIAFASVGNIKNNFPRVLLILLLLFIISLILILVANFSDFGFHFYGAPGRNTGFLTYVGLSSLLFASAASASAELMRKYSIAIISTGLFLALYGIAQWQGLDFFAYVNAYGTEVIGTFGNPNFQSAFMGITASTSMTWALLSSLHVRVRIFLFAISAMSLANIFLSSQQGYLNFLAGITSALLIFLFSRKKVVIWWTVLGTSALASIVVVLGIFNSGPLASVIYKSSLQARGFYWRAAINMMLEHPFFGVGLDGFGDWYRRSRTQVSAETYSAISADTAHSIPLDLGSSGGFPLLLLYLLIIGLAVVSIIRVVLRNAGFDVAFASIVAAWVAYQAQSVISINQIGLGVWGWSLTGLLIGYEVNTRNQKVEEASKSAKKFDQVKDKLPPATMLAAVVAGAIGLAVSLPPYLAANKFYKALQSGDGNLIQTSAYLKPYDRNRFLYTAQILAVNKLESNAIEVLEDASKIYPDNFDLWQQWSQIPTATPEQVSRAKAEMKRLDPFNPALK
jgi:O-antigen ligase